MERFQEEIKFKVNKKRVFAYMMQMVVILTALFLFVIPSNANTLNNWHVASSIPFKTSLYDVTFGDGTYVAVGNAGHILYSRDGESWTKATYPTTDSLYGVAYGNNKFVAVGSSGTILTSSDGVTWTQKNSGVPTASLGGVAFGENKFVIVGNSGTMLVSSDCEYWLRAGFPGTSYLTDVVYGNGKFNVIDNQGKLWSSESLDVNSWASQSISSAPLSDISYGNGVLLILDDYRNIHCSVNEGPWTKVTTDNLTGAVYGNGKFVAVGYSGVIKSSDSVGNNWDGLTSVSSTYQFTSVTYGNGKYVAVSTSGDIFVTTDKSEPAGSGAYWTTKNAFDIRGFNGISKYNNQLMVICEGGGLDKSINNGSTWTLGSSFRGINAITYYNGSYIAGNNGLIYYTTDATYIYPKATGTTADLYGITNDKGSYLAVGANGTVLKSNGGNTWTKYLAPTSKTLRGVTIHNEVCIAVGDYGAIMKSTDGGTTWTSCNSGITKNLYGVTNYKGFYIAVGENGTILKSTDGSTWSAIDSNTTRVLKSVANYAGSYIAVGECGTILLSTDGDNWVNASVDPSKSLKAVIAENGLYTIVGENGTILTSSTAPQEVTAVAGDKQATVSFTPPTGGAASYTVTAIPTTTASGIVRTQQGTGSPITVTGLENGVEYTIKITAYHTSGLPLPSSTATTTVIPSVAAGLKWNNSISEVTSSLTSTVYGDDEFVIVGNNGTILTSPMTTTNSTCTKQSFGSSFTLTGIAYGKGQYVAVGGSNGIIVSALSTDITKWNYRNSGTSNAFNAVTFGNDLFVAVGANTISTSSDGTTWYAQSTAHYLNNIAYGGGNYVAVGPSGKIVTSTNPTDPTKWVTRTQVTSYALDGIAYGNGKYVAVGQNGTILTSTDLVNWYPQTSGTTKWLIEVKYEAGMFIAVGESNTILTSIDGVTWYKQDENSTIYLQSVAYGNGKFLAVGTSGTIKVADYFAPASVPTGVTVAAGNGEATVSFTASTGNVGSYTVTATPVSGGAVITQNGTSSAITITGLENEVEYTIKVTAYDTLGNPSQPSAPQNVIPSVAAGLKWTQLSSGVTHDITGSVFKNNKFVLVGSSGPIMSSSLTPTDSTWFYNNTYNNVGFNGITYGNGRYFAASYNGAIIATPSEEIANWSIAYNPSTAFEAITYGNNTLVAVGQSVIAVSSNGTNWTYHTPNYYLRDIAYGNGNYVGVGESGRIYTSTTPSDTTKWTSRISGTTKSLYGITYGNGKYIAVGQDGTILASTDLVNWIPQVSGSLRNLFDVKYEAGMFIAVGHRNTILTSIDGKTWYKQEDNTNGILNTISYGNGKFLLSGNAGNIRIAEFSNLPPIASVSAIMTTAGNITAGTNADIKLTLSDSTFSGTMNVIVKGYLSAPDGSFGKITYPTGSTTNAACTLSAISTSLGNVYFSGGEAIVKLQLNNAAPQPDIQFNVNGVAAPDTNKLPITPVPDVPVTFALDQNVSSNLASGATFTPAPKITLKDKFGNVCTNCTATIIATKKDSGAWDPIGASNGFTVNGGSALLNGLGAVNTSNADISNAQYTFSIPGQAGGPTVDSNLFTILAPTITKEMTFELITPSSNVGGNSIAINNGTNASTKTLTVNVANNTATVIIKGGKLNTQNFTISGTHASSVSVSGSSTEPIFTINTDSIKNGGTKTFTITVNEPSTLMTDRIYNVTVNVASPSTSDISLVVTSIMPSNSQNELTVGGSIYSGNLNLGNGTTSVMLTGQLIAGQSVTIGGTDNLPVTVGGSAMNPTFTIDTSGISSGGSKTFTIIVKQVNLSDKVYTITVNLAQPATADITLVLSSVSPSSSGNTINVGGSIYSCNVLLQNGTTSVTLTGHLESGQSVTIGGINASFVTLGGSAADPTFTINTSGISNGGNRTFTLTVKESSKADKTYNVTVTVMSLLTVTANSQNNQPIAGENNPVTLTVYNKLGTKDNTFTGAKEVIISGYKAAPNGTIGSVTYPISSTTSTAIQLIDGTTTTINNVYFQNGEAILNLKLNAAELQNINISVKEIAIPAQINVTPLPAVAKAMVFGTPIAGPVANGDSLQAAPTITLKDQFGNICTNDTTTKVYASNVGFWKLSGTTVKSASGGTGTILFDDLRASSSVAYPQAILEFSSSKLNKVYSNEFNIPAPTFKLDENGNNWTESSVGYNQNLKGVTYGYNSTGAGLFVAVGDNGTIVNSFDKETWNKASNPDSNNRNLKGITYGNGTFVAVGDSGTVLLSSNGTLWRKPTSLPADVTGSLYGVTYGTVNNNGNQLNMFVAVGQSGVIVTSTDGEVWNKCTGSRTTLYSVANGGGKFVAVGTMGRAWESTDGANWNPCYSSSGVYLRGITYSDGVFYAVGDDTSILRYSVDPDSGSWLWTAVDQTKIDGYNGLPLSGIEYSGNTLISVGDEGSIVKSVDGINWITKSSGTGFHLASITKGKDAAGKEIVLAVGNNGGVYVTSYIVKEPDAPLNVKAIPGNEAAVIEFDPPNFDGGSPIIEYVVVNESGVPVASGRTSPITVSNLENGVNYTFYVIATNIAGQSVYSNPVSVTPQAIWDKGISWDGNIPILNQTLYSISEGNNKYVTVGDGGLLLTSPTNVINWQIENSGVNNTLYGVTYGGGLYVAVGSSGQIITSTDGSNWVSRKSNSIRYTLNAVAYGDGTFVAVGSGGNILTSINGIDWTPANSGTIYPLFGVTYGNGVFVAVGANGKVLTSTDGLHWTSSTIGIDVYGYFKGVNYNNSTFVIVGDFGVILTSRDGITWNKPESATECNINAVTYTKNTYIAVGGMGTILTSTDGSVWKQRNSGITDSIQGIVHFNGRFIAVGERGILSTSLVISPPEPPRNVSAIVGNQKAIISFDLPNTDGGSAITGYEIINEMGQVLATGDRSPITLNGLSNNCTYVLSVVAINMEGRSEPSEQVYVSPSGEVTVPGIPQNVTAVAGDGKALISFSAPATNGGSTITGYQISLNGKVIATGNESPILVPLNNGLTYTLEVAAVNIHGVGAGKTVSVTPLNTITKPSTPVINAYTAGNGRVSISFDPPSSDGGSPIIRYEIFSGTNKLATCKESPVIITGLTNNTTYTLAVSAVNIQGNSDLSTPIIVTPRAITAKPDPPLGLTAVAGNGKANLSFTIGSDGSSPITEYIITNNGSVLRRVSSSAITIVNNKANYLLEGLTNLTTYNLRVIAKNSIGESVPSNVVTLIPIGGAAQIPGVLNNVVATAGDGKAVISFDPPDSNGGSVITGYQVFKDGVSIASSKTSPIIVTGLTNDICYTLTVAAINIEGPGVPTIVQVTPSAIDAVPDPLRNLSAVTGNGKAWISFDVGSDGNSPILEYIVLNDGSEFTRINAADVEFTGSRGTFLLTNLTNGLEYKFRLVAVNGNSSSGSVPSEVLYVKTSATITIPSPPRNVTYTLGNGKVFIGFEPGSNGGSPILEYIVYSGSEAVAFGKQSPIVVGNLENYKIYTFTVVARNIEGNSLPSQSITVKPIVAATAPEPPKNVVADPGNAKAVIGFEPPDFDGGSPITGYEVITNNGTIVASGIASPVIVTGLINGKEYEFKVISINAKGRSVPSSTVKVVPTSVATVPDPPMNIVAKAGINKATISFSPGSDGGSRILAYIISSDDGNISVAGTGSPITISNLVNGTTYKFNVVAINSEGMSLASNTVSVTPMSSSTTPEVPENITAVAGNGKAVISFDQGYDGGYAITDYKVINDQGTWSTTINMNSVTVSGNRRSMVVSGLTNGVEYKFRIIAVNSNLDESVPSALVSVRPSALAVKPNMPTDISAVAGDTFIVVSFNKGSNSELTDYKVVLDSGNVVIAKASPILITGLQNGINYTITMSAINSEGESDPSAPITVQTISGAATISPPQNVIGTAGNGKAIIGFDPSIYDGGSPIKEYRVINQNDMVVATGLNSPITVNGLVNGNQYYFRVVAVNQDGNLSAPSSEVKVIPTSNITVPDAPENIVAIAGLNKAIICFNQGSDGGSVITGYKIIKPDGSIQATIPISNVLISGSRRNLTVTGLNNDVEYTFRVVAVNAKGDSVPSAIIKVIPTATTTNPSQPINLNATPGNASAVLSFDLDSDGGVPIKEFIIKEDGGFPDTTINITAASIIGGRYFLTVPGLTNGAAYRFRVIAVNQNGDSSIPSDSVSVTPSAQNIGGMTGYIKMMSSDRSGITVTIRSGGLMYSIQTDHTGKFEFKNIAAGTYSIEIVRPGYITRSINNVIVQSLVVNVSYISNPIDFIPGDVTGDNKVLYDDLLMLMAAYNSVNTDGKYIAGADFNVSGSINSIDLSALMGSYNKTQSSYTTWVIPLQQQ